MWDLAISSMKKNEVSYIYGHHTLAYDDKEHHNIPPYSDLFYYIELHDIFDKPKKPTDMTIEEKIQHSNILKDKAIVAFNKNLFIEALDLFNTSVDLFNEYQPHSLKDSNNSHIKLLIISLLNNISLCLFNLNDIIQSVQCAFRIIEIDNNNIKALYRYSYGTYLLKDYDVAYDSCSKLIELEPNNKLFTNLFKNIKSASKSQTQKEKKIYKNMFH